MNCQKDVGMTGENINYKWAKVGAIWQNLLLIIK